MKLIHSMQTEM